MAFWNRKVKKFVQNNGGMVKLHENLVAFFMKEDFEIREVKGDFIYLHHGTEFGKIGVSINQLNISIADITLITELPDGKRFEWSSKLTEKTNEGHISKGVSKALTESYAYIEQYENWEKGINI